MSEVFNTMYSKLPNLVIGFHGCNEDTYDKVLHDHQQLNFSKNTYDWLGNGIYFWENSYERAFEWAKDKYKHQGYVIGAVIDLGLCLNLTDYNSSKYLNKGYELLKTKCNLLGIKLPVNRSGRSETDLLLRDLDCSVIEQLHAFNRKSNLPMYDSVRGVFTEGKEVYPGSGFVEKTHIQICVRNPNCIKGYFKPREYSEDFTMP